MSKAVRIRNHLHVEIERLARENRRTIIDQLELLLEQAIRMDATANDWGVSDEEFRERAMDVGLSEGPDDHFKPDFKGGKGKQ